MPRRFRIFARGRSAVSPRAHGRTGPGADRRARTIPTSTLLPALFPATPLAAGRACAGARNESANRSSPRESCPFGAARSPPHPATVKCTARARRGSRQQHPIWQSVARPQPSRSAIAPMKSANATSRSARQEGGTSFSPRTRIPSTATQARFITPPANRSSISAQQQPRQ